MCLKIFKNKTFWIIALFVFLILVPEFTQANNFMEVCTWKQWLTFPATTFMCALNWIAVALIKIIFIFAFAVWTIPLMLFTTLFSIGISFLSASIVPLLSVPVLGSPVVTETWSFVRDFANLFFILFFVFIGLSTILKIESYKYQKTLPLLIIMALLINFSLVFVGLIVDMGNILTNVFLQPIQGGITTYSGLLTLSEDVLLNGINQIWSAHWGSFMTSITIAVGWIIYVLALIGVYFTILCVFWIIIVLFLFRIAILWTLAILSPLAFISYVFESTRKAIWQKWLENLIKWSIVAVPILFFMFIALQVLHSSPEQFQQIVQNLPTDETTGRITQLITVAFTPLISVMIMLIGVILSMTALPEGAQSAINAGKSSGAWIANTAKNTARKNSLISGAESKIMKGMESTALGRMFVGPTGTHEAKKQKEKEAFNNTIKHLQTEELIKVLGQLGTAPGQRAAILEKLAEKGSLDSNTYKKNINSAMIGGADKTKILQGIPLMAEDDKEFQKVLAKTNKDSFPNMHKETWSAHPPGSDEDKRQKELILRLVSGTGGTRGLSEKMEPSEKQALRHAVIRHTFGPTNTYIKNQIELKEPGRGDVRINKAITELK